jgi:hypothetical protein
MKKLALLLTLAMSLSAQAQRMGGAKDKLVLHIDEHMRGLNTIKLKQKLKQQYPGIVPQRLKLAGVKVVAKSKKGHGQVSLIVGQDISYAETIDGNPYDFHDNSAYTYDRIKIMNPSYDSMGKWQLELQGNIKVKKVVLLLKKRQRNNTVKINLYDQHLRGFNVLKIKQLIKQQNTRLDLQQMELQKVTLVAKSKQGRGEASLVVGQDIGYPEVIGGSPRTFHSMNPRSFDIVTLYNDSFSSKGKWQVELQGNIKVKEIIVTMKKKNQRTRGRQLL